MKVAGHKTRELTQFAGLGSELMAQAEERRKANGEGGRETEREKREGAPNDASREQNGAFRRQKPH
jgi:hypothetical protein